MIVKVQVSDGEYNPFNPKYKTVEREVVIGGGVLYRLTDARLNSTGEVLEIDEEKGFVLIKKAVKTGTPAESVWIPQELLIDAMTPQEFAEFRQISIDDDGSWADKENAGA